MEKHRKVYQEKIFFHARIFLLETAIKWIISNKLNNFLIWSNNLNEILIKAENLFEGK